MEISYKVLALLVVLSSGITVQYVYSAAAGYCHGDLCKNNQFCSETFKLCRDCEDVRLDCDTKDQPDECSHYCLDYKIKLALERQKEANCSALETNLENVAPISKTEYKQGDVISINCSPGYEPYYTNTAQCREYGTLQITPPTCTVQTCLLSPLIANTKNIQNLDSRSRANLNTTINIECKDGYILLGSNTMTCLVNNTWSTEAPLCLPYSYIWWHFFAIALIIVCCILFVICILLSVCLWYYHRQYKPKKISKPTSPPSISDTQTDRDLDETSRMNIDGDTRGTKRYSDYSTGSEGCSSCQTATAPPTSYESNKNNGNVTNITNSTTYNMYGHRSQHTDPTSHTVINVDETTNRKPDDNKADRRITKATEESQTTIEACQETQQGKTRQGAIPITEDNNMDIALDTVPLMIKKKFKD